MSSSIRLLLADDHQIVRMGLRTVCHLEPDMKVVAEAGTADEAVAAHANSSPDVTLLDLRMPGGGLEAMKRILSASPAARVLVLTTSDLEEDIHRAIAAGAAGYVLKSMPPADLADAIRAVHGGDRWIPDEIARRLKDRESSGELSAREREVLLLLAKGLTNPEIGTALSIAHSTVKVHVAHILEKLQVAGRTEAAAEAIKRGLISG